MIIICVNFYGHNNPAIAGIPAACAPLNRGFFKAALRVAKQAWFSNVVSEDRLSGCKSPKGTLRCYDYNSSLNEADNKALAERLLSKILDDVKENGVVPDLAFMITGYSAGGVSAMHLARLLKQKDRVIWYVGLADPAFQRNESEYLMSKPGFVAKHMKNYYQTLQNADDVTEIHDKVKDFTTNRDLSSQVKDAEDAHVAAVKLANDLMFNDVKWCLENC